MLRGTLSVDMEQLVSFSRSVTRLEYHNGISWKTITAAAPNMLIRKKVTSLAHPENRFAFYAVAEAFLAEHLGGRVERALALRKRSCGRIERDVAYEQGWCACPRRTLTNPY